MASVTIGSTSYTVYADVSTADTYFNGSADFSDWDALTTDTKARALVAATRLLDRQTWQGTLTSTSQELDFPRSGLTDKEGNEIDENTIPPEIIEASELLALNIALGGTVESSKTTEDLTRRLQAGSVSIENFRQDSANVGRWPVAVSELISIFLASGTTITNSLSFGVDGTSLDDSLDFSGGF